ncbi:MAG: RNA 2',3'-cyclic phosphodiesterase [Rhodobacteraceae bacterium]|nr:MAG: RNA 2',3'-cyclic phosphodiesterase [Paracoccaceae bacterium]
MRAFVAIDLPEEVTDALSDLTSVLPVGRSVPDDNLHLTLAFLGEQTEDQLEQLHQALEIIQVQAFDLGFDGLGSFGGDATKILFARIADSQALTDLHRKLRRAAHRAGIILPRERYRPHVTLARFGRGQQWRDAERLQGFIATHASVTLPPFSVGGFSLFQSTLHPDGAIHQRLADYGFGPQVE